MKQLLQNISKGVAFVHTLKEGIVSLKPGETKEFDSEDIVYKDDIFKEGSFFELVEKSEDGKESESGEKSEDGKESESGEKSEDDVESLRKEYLDLTGTEVSEGVTEEELKVALTEIKATIREAKINELRKAIARNNKTLVAELLSELKLSDEEKAELLPMNKSTGRKKTTNKRN